MLQATVRSQYIQIKGSLPLGGKKMTTNTLAVRVVSDGTFLLDGGPLFGQVPKTLWERTAKPDRKNRVRLG